MYDLSISKLMLQIDGIGPESQVNKYDITEGISFLFRIELELVLEGARLSPGEVVGRDARFTLESQKGIRYFHGRIHRFEYVGHHAGETYYRVEISPRLATLSNRYHSRIFQNKTVPEIVREVISRAGLGAAVPIVERLESKYPARDYCVQYRETDYYFISRLLEEEGIYYFFEHDANECLLVLCDLSTVRPASESDEEDQLAIPYHPPTGMNAPDEHVFSFHKSQEVRPGLVTLRDYNFLKPSLDLECHSDLGRDKALEISDYPGDYGTQARGHHVAKIRAEELDSRRRAASGQANCHRLTPALTFRLIEHPFAECNGEYFVTRVRHHGRQAVARSFAGGAANGVLDSHLLLSLQAADRHTDPAVRDLAKSVVQLLSRFRRSNGFDRRTGRMGLPHAGQMALDSAALSASRGGDPQTWMAALIESAGANGSVHLDAEAPIYECEFECIPSEVQYRPPRVTPHPVMRGCQTAIVVGPKDEEIYVDEHGRVKVQFYWDRDGKRNEHSSCWIRVSQAWAGKGFGGITLPRIGQEVIVDFLEGDPDQPIITGRVYNSEQSLPSDLPAQKTQSALRSRSSKDGSPSNFNEIRMEDLKGDELFYVQAEKDRQVLVKNNNSETVGANESIGVGSNRSKSVAENETTSIGVDRTETVGANESVTVGVNRSLIVGNNNTEAIGSNETRTVGSDQSVAVGSDQTNRVGSKLFETVGLIRSSSIGLLDNINAGILENINGGIAVSINAGVVMSLVAAGNSIVISPAGITIKANKITIVGGRVDINP